MRIHINRVLGLLFTFALFSPAAVLFCAALPQPTALTSPTANWAETEQATAKINQIQNLASKVRREDGPLTVEGEELNWQVHSGRLGEIRTQVNKMSRDLSQLSKMKNQLEPWQQQLVHSMTVNIHELGYQTQAAIKTLTAQHDTMALAMTQYPGYLNAIYHNANHLAGSIGTFTGYVRAAQKLATLQHGTAGAKARS